VGVGVGVGVRVRVGARMRVRCPRGAPLAVVSRSGPLVTRGRLRFLGLVLASAGPRWLAVGVSRRGSWAPRRRRRSAGRGHSSAVSASISAVIAGPSVGFHGSISSDSKARWRRLWRRIHPRGAVFRACTLKRRFLRSRETGIVSHGPPQGHCASVVWWPVVVGQWWVARWGC